MEYGLRQFETTSSGRRVIMALAFIGYFILWLTPRMAPIEANVLMADDFTQDPRTHLLSYRPLLYADLWFWNLIMGNGYLMTMFPKLLAGIYLSLAAMVTFELLQRWGISLLVSLIIPVFYLSHPIVNELSLWNTIASCNLSMLLILIGYQVMGDSFSLQRTVYAIFLIALGVSGYQIYAGLLVVLIIGEPIIKKINNIHFSAREVVRKTMIIFIALAIYVLYIKISQNVFGLYDFGNRSFVSPVSSTMADFVDTKWHGMSNMFANVFQSLISFYFGAKASFHAWKWVPIGMGCLTLIISLLAKRSWHDTAFFALTPVLLPALATSILLPINATPSGWRVCGPVLFAFSLSMVPTLSLIMKSDAIPTIRSTIHKRIFGKTAVVTGIAVFWLAITIPVITYHSSLRVIANKKELETLRSMDTFWKERGLVRGGYMVAVYPADNASRRKTFVSEEGRDIVINFNRVVSYDYSNLVKGFWPQFLMHYGYRPLTESAGEDEMGCILKDACEKQTDTNHVKSYLNVAHLDWLKLSVICR